MCTACGYSCSRYPEGPTFEYRYTRDQGIVALSTLPPGADSICLALEIADPESEIFCGAPSKSNLTALLDERPHLAAHLSKIETK